MKNTPLISVIVPVYNVEPYLDRCVQSIVDQTYTNLEIILVDDGSPDNCPAMCDAWAARDTRIKAIHQENGGLSDARNAGLAEASGEYVAFIDSDDWVEPEFLRFLLLTTKENQSEIAGSAYRLVEDVTEPPPSADSFETTVYPRDEALSALIADRVRQVVWNKLYARTLIADIPFEKGKFHEDEFWSYKVFSHAERYAQIDYIGYNYLQRAGSIMGERYSLKRLDAVEAKTQRQAFLEDKMPSLAPQGRISLYFTCLYHGQLALRDLKGDEQKQAFERLEDAVKHYPLSAEDKKSLSFTHRLWAEMSRISFVLTCRVRNLFRIGL